MINFNEMRFPIDVVLVYIRGHVACSLSCRLL